MADATTRGVNAARTAFQQGRPPDYARLNRLEADAARAETRRLEEERRKQTSTKK